MRRGQMIKVYEISGNLRESVSFSSPPAGHPGVRPAADMRYVGSVDRMASAMA
jgi:hypothetical protein